MSGGLWLFGTFSNFNGGVVGQQVATYATPELIVADGVVATRVTTAATFYLTATGDLYGAGLNSALGLGASGNTNGVFVLLDTGVSAIFDTHAVSGNVFYRKETNYWVRGDCSNPSQPFNGKIQTSLGLANTFPTGAASITSLAGLDVVSITGGEVYCAITAEGDVYVVDGTRGDAGGLRYNDWATAGFFGDGNFHSCLTSRKWCVNSAAGSEVTEGFIGVPQTPNNTLYVTGFGYSGWFSGYTIPTNNAIGAVRPTPIFGAWGTMTSGVLQTRNGFAQIRTSGNVACYISSGQLHAHKLGAAIGITTLTGTPAVGLIGGEKGSANDIGVMCQKANGFWILRVSPTATSTTLSEIFDSLEDPALIDSTVVHAAAGDNLRAFALVLEVPIPAPPPFDFWENLIGVEQYA